MTRFTHCIVHAGMRKTGATTRQDVFSANRAELATAGFFYDKLSGLSRAAGAISVQSGEWEYRRFLTR